MPAEGPGPEGEGHGHHGNLLPATAPPGAARCPVGRGAEQGGHGGRGAGGTSSSPVSGLGAWSFAGFVETQAFQKPQRDRLRPRHVLPRASHVGVAGTDLCVSHDDQSSRPRPQG